MKTAFAKRTTKAMCGALRTKAAYGKDPAERFFVAWVNASI
jgi:hypothetical protein